jgi:hypothetical protein
MPLPTHKRGKVLFIILIAIVLFGALSFVVAAMMRDGDSSSLSREKSELMAAEILDRAQQFHLAVQEARAGHGCAAEDISFANNSLNGYEHTPASAIECQIFHASKDDFDYTMPAEDWLDNTRRSETRFGEWFFTGDTCVYEVGTGGTACATANEANDSELVAVLPWVKRDICIAINHALGLAGPTDSPPQASGRIWISAMNPFTGSFSQGGSIQSGTSGASVLTGTMAGCFEGDTNPPSGSYHFYQVLIAR